MLNHLGTAVLHSARLTLRPYRESDAGMMYRNWASDPEVCRYLSWLPHKEISETQQILCQWTKNYDSSACYHWGITLDGELIGDIAVVRWVERIEEAEVGYCLGRAWWGQGIMTEALKCVNLYLFESIGFHRLTVRHIKQNQASGKVMQKAGMAYEGCMTALEKLHDGSFADVCIYGAINNRWRADRR